MLVARRPVPAALAALALCFGPGRAVADDDGATSERPRPRIDTQASVSVEAALDTNARRVQMGPAVTTDGLAYLFATGRLESRSPGRLFVADADLGAKRFLQTAAEDTVVGRLGLRIVRAPRPGLVLGAEAAYKDKVQRGDPWESVADDPHLRCARPAGTPDYRCNRRDYRHGLVAGSAEARHHDWTLQGRAGGSLLDYKPNRQFSYAGPDFSLSVARPLGERHVLRAFAGGSLRHYHPDSVTYRFVPSADRITVQEVAGVPRIERLFSGGIAWRYRSPVLVSTTLSVASSRNNSDGMDVLRGRVEVAGAMRLGEATTVVASAAFQLAHYPQGNVFRRIALVADEDERQNALALQMTHRLSENLALVVKAQAYGNEFSGDALPFRRQVIHGGVRWSR
jgi:hypothetical protein